MEALALGRPVLSTYIAGIPELVEPDACGWLVPAGSVDALVKAMLEVLRASPERLEELGGEGRRRVLASHDTRTATDPLVEAFEQSGRGES
jgi:glycosyltransferase involved in cell wall biosynthesis